MTPAAALDALEEITKFFDENGDIDSNQMDWFLSRRETIRAALLSAQKTDAIGTHKAAEAKRSDTVEALQYFSPPFEYEAMGQTITALTKTGRSMCLQVRGWGNLTGCAANNLPLEKAEKIQDEFGQWVASLMNGKQKQVG